MTTQEEREKALVAEGKALPEGQQLLYVESAGGGESDRWVFVDHVALGYREAADHIAAVRTP